MRCVVTVTNIAGLTTTVTSDALPLAPLQRCGFSIVTSAITGAEPASAVLVLPLPINSAFAAAHDVVDAPSATSSMRVSLDATAVHVVLTVTSSVRCLDRLVNASANDDSVVASVMAGLSATAALCAFSEVDMPAEGVCKGRQNPLVNGSVTALDRVAPHLLAVAVTVPLTAANLSSSLLLAVSAKLSSPAFAPVTGFNDVGGLFAPFTAVRRWGQPPSVMAVSECPPMHGSGSVVGLQLCGQGTRINHVGGPMSASASAFVVGCVPCLTDGMLRMGVNNVATNDAPLATLLARYNGVPTLEGIESLGVFGWWGRRMVAVIGLFVWCREPLLRADDACRDDRPGCDMWVVMFGL